MRLRVFSIFASLFALTVFVSGCSWLPVYMKAKAAINERYEKKEAQIESRYAKGEINDETYDRLYEELYAAWDEELTVAKAKAQGEVVASRRSPSKRRAPSSNTTARFDTYTAEYVGSTSNVGSSNSPRTGSSPSVSAPAPAQ